MATTKKKVEETEDGHVWYNNDGKPHVKVVSIAPYPLMVPVHQKVGDRGTMIEIGKVKLMPGENILAEDDWNRIRDLPLIKKRLDERWLQPGPQTRNHRYDLTEVNRSKFIEEHCKKARHQSFDDDLELDSAYQLKLRQALG